MNDQPFSTDQQEYLKGFMTGVEARRGALGFGGPAQAESDPTDLAASAQDRTRAEGGKLTPEEEAKRATPPFDRWDAFTAMSADGKYPKGTDVLLTKFMGLFYVAPAQNSYMCRLRIPGGILSAHQLHAIADIAAGLGGGYADITTRANFQIREITAENAPEVVLRLGEAGLTSRGSGADNVRNITGSPTAGIDPQELIDTRPFARAMHHHILHHRELYGLPRKFNIAYDGGGTIPVLEDTNDIAFTAVRIGEGAGIEPGIWFRLALGGITGHRDFARPTGIVVRPDDALRVATAILRVFILNGDRTNRARARLKYLLDSWGLPKFLEAVETELGAPLARVDDAAIAPRPPQDRLAHIGVHPQKQEGLFYIGLLCPTARLPSETLHALADIAARYGSGTLRLTVWQNLLISDIPAGRLDAALEAIAATGLRWEASNLRAGLVACTGNAGCKFAASNTKSHAQALVEYLDSRITVDQPLNIHLTGCHHSCAQHYIADIGLLGARVERGEETVEGYDLHVGGGAGAEAAIGRLIRRAVTFDELPPLVLNLLTEWQCRRADQSETFQAFTARMDDAELAALCGATVEA